jgi:hypothetical protein
MGLAAFWAILSHTHPVTLVRKHGNVGKASQFLSFLMIEHGGARPGCSFIMGPLVNFGEMKINWFCGNTYVGSRF